MNHSLSGRAAAAALLLFGCATWPGATVAEPAASAPAAAKAARLAHKPGAAISTNGASTTPAEGAGLGKCPAGEALTADGKCASIRAGGTKPPKTEASVPIARPQDASTAPADKSPGGSRPKAGQGTMDKKRVVIPQ